MNPRSERRHLKLAEVRAVQAEGKPTMLVGYAVVYDSLSEDLGYFREKIQAGAFTESLKSADVRALIDHDPSKIIGRNKSGTLRLFDEPRGLRVEIDLPDTAYARDLMAVMERGDVDGMSFGFRVAQNGEKWVIDEMGFGTRTIVKADIDDVSVVTYPAYTATDVEIAKRSLDSWKETQVKPPAIDAATELRKARLRIHEITTPRA